jgi:ribosome-associated translation inhibitor RaiA
MRIRYHGNGQITNGVRYATERAVESIDRRLARMNDDLKSLDVTVTHHERDNTYSARLVLRVPGHELPAAGHGMRRDAAVRDAFADLNDVLERYLTRLRREPAIRRASRAREMEPALPETEPEPLLP